MKKDMCVLIIHGFGGGEHEVINLFDYLTERGYECRLARLHGHTGKYVDFMMSDRKMWVKSADDMAKELKEQYERVVIVGFSMGGLIAAAISKEMPLEAMIFANTPMIFCDKMQMMRNLTENFGKYMKKYLSSAVKTPPNAVIELWSLLRETKQQFKAIGCRCLILQCEDDDTANKKSARIIGELLKGESSVVYFKKGGHKIFCGPSSDIACDEILRFIESGNGAVNGHALK